MFHRGTTIGRYSFLAETVRTFTRNHPMNTKSSHALFYNTRLGKVKNDPVPRTDLIIGHGVWIGHNSIILPSTERIGDGAIIAAGSVISTNVRPYAMVSGFPARVTGFRFSKEIIAELIASGWWDYPLQKLDAEGAYYRRIVDCLRPHDSVSRDRGKAPWD